MIVSSATEAERFAAAVVNEPANFRNFDQNISTCTQYFGYFDMYCTVNLIFWLCGCLAAVIASVAALVLLCCVSLCCHSLILRVNRPSLFDIENLHTTTWYVCFSVMMLVCLCCIACCLLLWQAKGFGVGWSHAHTPCTHVSACCWPLPCLARLSLSLAFHTHLSDCRIRTSCVYVYDDNVTGQVRQGNW